MQIALAYNQTLTASDNITEYLKYNGVGFEPRQTPIPLGSKETRALDNTEYIDGEIPVELQIDAIDRASLDTFVTTFLGSWQQASSVEVTVTWLANDYTYDKYNAKLHPIRAGQDFDPVWRDQYQNVRFRLTLVEAI